MTCVHAPHPHRPSFQKNGTEQSRKTTAWGRRWSVLELVLALGLLAWSGGCASPQTELVAHPLPHPVNLTGKWDTNWGRLELVQTGNSVQGTSDYRDGRLRGTVDGDLLLFDWEQPGDPSAARQAVSGRGWYRISPDGRVLDGKWGYGTEREGGGSWHAERARS